MSGLAIRRIRNLDEYRALLPLMRDYQQFVGIDFGFQGHAEEALALERDFGGASGSLLIVPVEGEIAGCLGLRALEPGIGELKRMFVSPRFQGRGLGMALIQAAFAEARTIGHHQLRLDSAKHLHAAHRLYQRAGFRPIPPYGEQATWDIHFLGLDLDPKNSDSPHGRAAVPGDLPGIMALISAVVTDMRSHGIHQWDAIYPAATDVAADLAAGTAHVLLHQGVVIAYVCVNEAQMPEYATFSWHGSHPAVVHRLMVHPTLQRRGLARRCLAWAECAARAAGYDSLRLDAFLANPAARAFYPDFGYRQVGTVSFRTGPFALFERRLR